MFNFLGSSMIFEDMFNFEYVYTNGWYIVLLIAVIAIIGVVASFVTRRLEQKRGIERKTSTRELVLGATCIAISFVLSFIRIFRLSNAGSVTLASVLPIALYCYMFGFNKSMTVCFAFALLNFLQGPYVISPWSALLDYLLPYLALAAVGLFAFNRKKYTEEKGVKNHWKFFVGLAIYFGIRLFSHTLAGVLFWSEGVDFWVFEGDLFGFTAVAYSLVYNLSYLLPDTLVTAVAGFFVLRSKTVNRMLLDYTAPTVSKENQ